MTVRTFPVLFEPFVQAVLVEAVVANAPYRLAFTVVPNWAALADRARLLEFRLADNALVDIVVPGVIGECAELSELKSARVGRFHIIIKPSVLYYWLDSN